MTEHGVPEDSAALHQARGTLMRRLFGSRVTEVVGTAVRMGVADAIGDGRAEVGELARACEISTSEMHRLLRALASIGLCAECAPGTFALTEAGALLRQGHPNSMYEFARFHTSSVVMDPWRRLDHSIKTGRPAFDMHFGQPLYQYFANDAELTALFNVAMSEESRETAAAVAGTYDFSRFGTVTDIGGGDGTLMAAILRANPGLRGVIFETAEGAAGAAETIKTAGLDGRCTVATGDFFEAIPAGSDLYVIKSVVHNWDDERAAAILGNCRAALPPHGRLLVIDVVLPEQAAPDAAGLNPYIKDLQMLVLVGGRERTRADFDHLCARAGLVITDVVPLPPHVGLSVIEMASDTTAVREKEF